MEMNIMENGKIIKEKDMEYNSNILKKNYLRKQNKIIGLLRDWR